MSNRFVTALAALIILGSATLAYAAHDVVVYGTDTGSDSDPTSLITNDFGFISGTSLQKIGETLDPGCALLGGGLGAPCAQPYSGILPSNRSNPFAVPDDARASYRGLAWDPNTSTLHATIRAWRRNGDPDHMIVIPNTGQVSELEWPDSDTGSVTASLTYDPVTNLLYATGGTSGTQFMSYPLGEGNNTTIGNLPGVTWAIAIDKDDANGILYGIGIGSNGFQTLVTINKVTAAFDSEIAEFPNLPEATAMTIIHGKIVFTANMAGSLAAGTWGPGGKELWEVGLDGSNLTLLNFDLGRHVSGLTTIPVDAVPEPSSMVLLAMGLMGLFGYGFSRRRNKAA